MDLYPNSKSDRDRWIVAQRSARAAVSPFEPYGFFTENEADGRAIVSVATVLLTNRECPWKCVMCDLWKNTLTAPVEPGAIPAQIRLALSRLGTAQHIKLYNSGSFFDTGAIPEADYPAIADLLQAFKRVIVECHPALITERMLRFRDRLKGRLEVAMGLETAHPAVLMKLNKGMNLEQFRSAAAYLQRNEISLRVFLLVQPPFLAAVDALFWTHKSIDFAFECNARVTTLIPTRAENGAMEILKSDGQFEGTRLETLEAALNYGIGLQKGLVFADLWDLKRAVMLCQNCFERRRDRLEKINLTQRIWPTIECSRCEKVE